MALFDKLMTKFEKKQNSESNEKNISYPNDVISSNEYSSSNFVYDKFREKNKDFKPLFILGALPIKTQYIISGAFILIGLLGSSYIYQNYHDNIIKLNYSKSELTKISLDLNKKNHYLNHFEFLNENVGKNEIVNIIGDKNNINALTNQFGSIVRDLNFENKIAVIEVFDEFKNVQEMYASYFDNYVKQSFEINELLTNNIVNLKNAQQKIEEILFDKNLNQYLSSNLIKRDNLNNLLIEIKNVIILLENKNSVVDLKLNKNNFVYTISGKLKQINHILMELNKHAWNNVSNTKFLGLLNYNTNQINSDLNKFLTQQTKIHSQVNEIKNENYRNSFEKLVSGIEKIQNDLASLEIQNLNDFEKIYITLIIFLIGLILFFLIRNKYYEYEKQISIQLMGDVLKNIDSIEKDIDIYIQNKNHKISSRKSKRVMRLVDSINVMWDKQKQINNNITDWVEEIKKGLNHNNEIVLELSELEREIRELNKFNLEELDDFNKILIKNNDLSELYSNNVLNINEKEREIDDAIVDNVKVFNDLNERNEKVLKQVLNLIKLSASLKEVSNEINVLSDSANVLSYNANILSRKQSDNSSFIEISDKINNISDKYLKLSEKIKFITDNVSENFEFITLNLNAMEKQLSKSKVNSELLFNKHKALKPKEIKIKEGREEIDKLFKDLHLASLKENIEKINEGSKILDKKISSYNFNSSLMENNAINIIKLVEIKKEHK